MRAVAGGGVKTFVHCDCRLRGFSSMSTVSHTSLPPTIDAASRKSPDDISALDAGYRAVYRLVCGGGYGTFTLWQVCLESVPVTTSTSTT